MANIMTMTKLKNTPSRNGFDLSRKFAFTAKLGELLPVKLYLRHKSHLIQTAQEHKKHKLQNDANGYWLKQHNL